MAVEQEGEIRDIGGFVKEVMRRRNKKPAQLARDIGVSHATILRWLSGEDIPRTESCSKLARYSGWPLADVLALAGHIPNKAFTQAAEELPEFREYAQRKYPKLLDEDEVSMIEVLIERRRDR